MAKRKRNRTEDTDPQDGEVQDAEDEQGAEEVHNTGVSGFTISDNGGNDIFRIMVNKKFLFYVSKAVLSSVPWFKTSFSERWNTEGTPRVFEMFDDPEAFQISMHILHNQPQLLPKALKLSSLACLATFADKYDLVDTIFPQVTHRGWTDTVWEEGNPKLESLLVLPWILQVFSDTEKLQRVYDLLASNMYRHIEYGWVVGLGLDIHKVSDIYHKDVPEQEFCSKSISIPCKNNILIYRVRHA
jgi:hypothetical protein